jgi:hypothetical protein
MAARSVRSVDVDADLLSKARAGSRRETADAELVDHALRLYVGRQALDESQRLSDLTEDEALRIAYEELHAMRNSTV